MLKTLSTQEHVLDDPSLLTCIKMNAPYLSAEDVEPQPSAREGHHETANVTDVPDGPGPHQRQENVVVLLPLVPES